MLKIGIDGGATTTRAVIISQEKNELQVLGRGEAASSNHYGVGLEDAVKNIRSAINGALNAAGLLDSAIEGFGFGLAGACTPAEQSLLSGPLSALAGDRPYTVDEDAAAAQSGAFGGSSGAICIAGTGANCFGINEKNERARADGVGPLLGDRGGGYRIGEAALRAICSAHDGSGPSTQLLEACLQTLEVGTIDELVQLVYQPNFTRSQIAALFPTVLQVAENGDSIAQSLLESAGRELAATTLAVLEKLQLKRVAVVGGVIENAKPVRDSYETHLQKRIPQIEVVAPLYDAAIGAALFVHDRKSTS